MVCKNTHRVFHFLHDHPRGVVACVFAANVVYILYENNQDADDRPEMKKGYVVPAKSKSDESDIGSVEVEGTEEEEEVEEEEVEVEEEEVEEVVANKEICENVGEEQ